MNQTTERTLHDEVVKELALYLKQQDSANIAMLLNVRRWTVTSSSMCMVGPLLVCV